MEWDCVSEDILHVVKGEQIRVDLFVLLAQGRRNAIFYRVQISDILQSATNIFRVGEFLRHMMMFDMRGFGKGTPAVFR